MTRDEFKQLQVGDRVTHPAFSSSLTIAEVETSYDYATSPPHPLDGRHHHQYRSPDENRG